VCASANDSEQTERGALDSDVEIGTNYGELLLRLFAKSGENVSLASQIDQLLNGFTTTLLPVIFSLFLEKTDCFSW
jgi:hypothetical protein